MNYYIYTSFIKHKPKSIDSLMSGFQENNRRHGVTGLLLYNNGNVIQLFEGPKEKTTQLYNNLLIDPRHVNFTLLLSEDIQERNFPDWEMGLITPHNQDEWIEKLPMNNPRVNILFEAFKRVCSRC